MNADSETLLLFIPEPIAKPLNDIRVLRGHKRWEDD
jgi:hypothetical protein